MFAGCNFTHEDLRGFLPFDFARVNVRLNVDSKSSGTANGLRRGISNPADNGQWQRAALEGVAKRRDMDERRPLRDRIEKRDDVIVPARLNVVGPFGPRFNLRQRTDIPSRAYNQNEDENPRSHAFTPAVRSKIQAATNICAQASPATLHTRPRVSAEM